MDQVSQQWQTTLLQLDRVQKEGMPVILGKTKDTPTETMRFTLDLPPMQTRQKMELVKAYFSAVENPHNSHTDIPSSALDFLTPHPIPQRNTHTDIPSSALNFLPPPPPPPPIPQKQSLTLTYQHLLSPF